MPAKTLAEKMKLKPEARAAIINEPPDYRKKLGRLPKDVTLSQTLSGRYDWIQIFIRTRAELEAVAPILIKALKPDGLLWLSFPKGSSRIQTDLTRDQGWESVSELKWVTLISVDETWSAFALRPYKPGEPQQAPR